MPTNDGIEQTEIIKDIILHFDTTHNNPGLKLLTNNVFDISKLCKEYWDVEYDKDNNIIFKKTVKEIAEEYGLKMQTVTKIIQEFCFVINLNNKCEICGEYPEQYKMTTRSAFNSNKYHQENIICNDCGYHRQQEIIAQKEKEKEAKFQKNLKLHKLAIENAGYELLSTIELAYCVNFMKTGSLSKAAKVMGVSKEKANKYHSKLQELYLIIRDKNDEYVYVDKDFDNRMKNLNVNNKVKPILTSKIVTTLYKNLRREHLYVYPEIPICAFIKKEDVETLFTESWHSGYFLMCRLDFVITDQNSLPKFGVEFQGSYHQNSDQKIKDDFKEALLNEVGLSIQYYTYADVVGD